MNSSGWLFLGARLSLAIALGVGVGALLGAAWAGQAVVLEAGGCVVDLAGQPLRYNVRDTVTNPSFIVYADRTRDWVALLGGL